MVRQLGLRAIVNLFTAAGVVVLLLVLRVDFPLMWGILAFFLSFIPWIGLPLAVAPPWFWPSPSTVSPAHCWS